jgi:hypothetical protein
VAIFAAYFVDTNQNNLLMKIFEKSYILTILLMAIIALPTFAQDFASLDFLRKQDADSILSPEKPDRAKQIIQFNEYTSTGDEKGYFYENPLMLNGKPLDYNFFGPQLKGELTVVKGAPGTGYKKRVPFYVYLRRNGNKVPIQGSDLRQTEFEISLIIQHAKPGDQLVIEAVNKVDGRVKRILRLPDGC